MLDFLKHIFQRQSPRNSSSQNNPLTLADEAMPNGTGFTEAQPSTQPASRSAGNGKSEANNRTSVDVSLQTVFTAFPSELKTRIRQVEVGEATVSVSMEKVLPQLPHGAVHINYGELRRAAPQLFAPGNECDQVLINLPLNEILLQIDASLLARRHDQKQIEVPDEVRSPFGEWGNGSALSVSSGKSQAPAAARTPVPPPAFAAPARTVIPAASIPAAPRSTVPPAQPTAVPRAAIPPGHTARMTRTPIPPGLPPVTPMTPHPLGGPAPATPVENKLPLPPPPQQTRSPGVPLSHLPPIHSRSANPIGSTPTPPAIVPRPAGSPPASSVPTSFRGVGAAIPGITPTEFGIPRSTAPSVRPQKAQELPALTVALAALAENWPEALRHEIAQLNLVEAKVALPANTIEQALKRGKVSFAWKVLRSWIKPAPLPTVSAHDNSVLDLPLKVIAPLFLNRQNEPNKAQQKVLLDESIPNLFFGFPQPQPGSAAPAPAAPSPSHAVSKPVDTNYYIWDDASDTAIIEKTEQKPKPEPSPGTTFVTRYATPNEVVSRAAALDGVSGALIALPDGLMVASRLSPDLNGDTLAAFLPQIFGKVSQCTKELRMGELNNLNFTVGNVPWKIFRVNAIFFAVFGHPGQPLPTGQLVALAAELDRKKQ
jgi:predicted regulator of Ras-like GTPase activity (Roadblock/LC7/MglB family)